MTIPTDRKYAETHEWFQLDGEAQPSSTKHLRWYRSFGGLLLLACDIETLLWVLDPVKCLLE